MSASEAEVLWGGRIPRRDFLGAVATLGLSTTGWSRLAQGIDGVYTDVPAQEDLFVINMLGGFFNPNARTDGSGGAPFNSRALADAVDSGMRAVNVTVGGFAFDPPDSFAHTVNGVARWAQMVQGHPDVLLRVWHASDIDVARQQGRIGVIFGFQNAAMMGSDVSRVRTFADLGVRIIQLTYNGVNQLGHGATVPENAGLTTFGHEVVEALEAADVLVDLSHSGERTCLDALHAASRPVAITHTGCRALTDLPSNKTDQELRLVAETGGIACIFFVPFYLVQDGLADAMDVVRHVEHAIDVCGEDHVGIGTDNGTTQIDDMEAFLAAPAREVERGRMRDAGAIVPPPGVSPMIRDLHGPDQFRRLARMLMDRGHSAARVEKIMGLNALRVMREVWRG